MGYSTYLLNISDDVTTFEFVSKGRKGSIPKVIQFQKTEVPLIYNLAFGDKALSGLLDDLAVTDNGDTFQVLASVVQAVYNFSEAYPSYWIYATGSTPSRTRLYQMAINKFFDLAIRDFEIFGELEDGLESYTKG